MKGKIIEKLFDIRVIIIISVVILAVGMNNISSDSKTIERIIEKQPIFSGDNQTYDNIVPLNQYNNTFLNTTSNNENFDYCNESYFNYNTTNEYIPNYNNISYHNVSYSDANYNNTNYNTTQTTNITYTNETTNESYHTYYYNYTYYNTTTISNTTYNGSGTPSYSNIGYYYPLNSSWISFGYNKYYWQINLSNYSTEIWVYVSVDPYFNSSISFDSFTPYNMTPLESGFPMRINQYYKYPVTTNTITLYRYSSLFNFNKMSVSVMIFYND